MNLNKYGRDENNIENELQKLFNVIDLGEITCGPASQVGGGITYEIALNNANNLKDIYLAKIGSPIKLLTCITKLEFEYLKNNCAILEEQISPFII